MNLLDKALRDLHTSITKDGQKIRLRVVGTREKLPKNLLAEIERIEALEIFEPTLTLWLALSYGGRAEIVAATNRAIKSGVPVTEETFKTHMWTSEMPDPDLIIRTSGEMRLSNFLLWQVAYSEFFFTTTMWPDFGTTEFQSILEEYGKRSRRKGS